ncbi:MAG: DUF2877 domain-containing protein [Candidatus Rokubacteria bacterium]|nr:DUF2877 domain-containing protein [Candidatus Rokubacteria bacterium]
MVLPILEASPPRPRLTARRVSALIPPHLAGGPPPVGRVHSAFARAFNIDLGGGRLLAIHGPGPLRAPFAVALAEPPAPPPPAVGTEVTMRRQGLAIGGWLIDLEAAERVDVRLTPAPPGAGPRGLGAVIDDIAAMVTAGPLRRPVARASLALEAAIERRDGGAFIRASLGLIGLGEGLTPAGDDILVGALAALHRFAPEWLAEHPGIGAELAAAGRTTTPIARDFLEHALAGAFSELVLDVVAAPTAEAARALARRLLGFGATSGGDTLAGLQLALRALSV